MVKMKWDEALTEEAKVENEAETVKDEQAEVVEVEAKTEEADKSDEAVEVEEEKKEHQVPLKALLAERDKARDFKAELDALKSKVDNLDKKPEEEVNIDPDTKAYIDRRENEMFIRAQNLVINASVELLKKDKERFPDYEEKEKIFIEAAKKDPSLELKMRQAGNPALFAYETAKVLDLQNKLGTDPEAWMKHYEAEAQKKLEAKTKKKQKEIATAGAKQPTNLDNLRAAGGDEKSEYKQASWGDFIRR
jgi:hypothetical protein